MPKKPNHDPIDDDGDDELPGEEPLKPASRNTRTVDITTWPTRAMAARRLKCALSTLKKYQSDGNLNPVKDENGTYRFDPQELAECAGTTPGEDDIGASDLLKAAVALARQSGEHQERMLQLIEGPMRTIQETFTKMLGQAYERNATLEKQHSTDVDVIEQAKSQEHERIMAERELAAREAHTARIFSVAAQYAPMLLNRFLLAAGPKESKIPTEPPMLGEAEVAILIDDIKMGEPDRMMALSMFLGEGKTAQVLELARTFAEGKRPPRESGEALVESLVTHILNSDEKQAERFGVIMGPTGMARFEAVARLYADRIDARQRASVASSIGTQTETPASS
jgi:hypothetical protein